MPATTKRKERQLSLVGIFRWKSALEVSAFEPEEPNYLVQELVVRGAITQVTAKIKAGKTTLLHTIIKGMLHEEEILNLKTKRAKVLYCTEEGPVTFTAALRRNGLDSELDLGVLHLQDVDHSLNWANIANGILDLVMSENIDVVIFDTLTRWARIRDDKENDAGTASYIMEYLEILRKASCGIIIVFHEKKSGGDISDASRGSSAYGGAADILVQLSNANQNGHSNRRRLLTTGRLYESREWLIEYEDGEYKLLKSTGTQEDKEEPVETLAYEREIYSEGITKSLSSGAWLSSDEIALDLGVDTKNQTFRRALNQHIHEGRIERRGEGKKGSRYEYHAIGVTAAAY